MAVDNSTITWKQTSHCLTYNLRDGNQHCIINFFAAVKLQTKFSISFPWLPIRNQPQATTPLNSREHLPLLGLTSSTPRRNICHGIPVPCTSLYQVFFLDRDYIWALFISRSLSNRKSMEPFRIQSSVNPCQLWSQTFSEIITKLKNGLNNIKST